MSRAYATRRSFIGGGCAISLAALASQWRMAEAAPSAREQSLCYWCTWGVQNALCRMPGAPGRPVFSGDQGDGSLLARNSMSEALLFGEGGWSRTMFPKSRMDILLMLDDGWDVPFGADPRKSIRPFGALAPAAARFPELGASGAERLKNLDSRVKDNGWRGTALWVACQSEGEGNGVRFDERRTRAEWRRRMEQSGEAGIWYWKVDWGCRDGDVDYRRLVCEVRDEVCPGLIVEHKPLSRTRPFNGLKFPDGGGCVGTGRIFRPEDSACADWSKTDIGRLLMFSDVVRIYDTLQPVEVATSFDRIAYYGMVADKVGSKSVLNVEDCVVAGAVLGHAFGIMRVPGVVGGIYGAAPDVSHICSRIAEVDRAVAWQRFAPAFGGRADSPTRFSESVLVDEWRYQRNEGWLAAAWGRLVRQGAPAAISRGMALPEVRSLEAETPFVAAMRHPNGSVSVGTFPRCVGGRYWTPRAEVILDEAPVDGQPLGVFGEMSALRFKNGFAGHGLSVFARDLAGGELHDITNMVTKTDGGATIPGDVLAAIGREAAPGDIHSAPGVLVFSSVGR